MYDWLNLKTFCETSVAPIGISTDVRNLLLVERLQQVNYENHRWLLYKLGESNPRHAGVIGMSHRSGGKRRVLSTFMDLHTIRRCVVTLSLIGWMSVAVRFFLVRKVRLSF